MTEVDENLLTIAKLREVVNGDLEVDHRLHPHAGIADDRHPVLSFLESTATERPFAETELGSIVLAKAETEAASRAVFDSLPGVAAHLVGVTETEYDGSALSVVLRILEAIENGGAPSFWSIAGNPNTGKTNTLIQLVEVADRGGELVEEIPGDLTVVSNVGSWDRTDVVVKSMHDLMLELLELRDEPKVVAIDEGSTHFDARTFSWEVAEQWTPAAKRFAKLGVAMVGVVGHTGKDLHPEVKRLTTSAIWKETKKEARFYHNWPGDADRPADPMFPDPVQDFEKATSGYDPDDAAPWAWNLRAELFAEDATWPELLELLRERGPAPPE